MSKKITAVVPTRKGSQRVKNKNTRPFADTCLLELKLNVLKSVDYIDEIIVNTDCETSISIAKKMGIKVHEREPFFASSDATNDQHWQHLAQTTDTDIIMIAQTTSPMVKVSTYEKAINKFLSDLSTFDSINSVTPEKKFLWENMKPLNYNPAKTPKSQDLPDIVSLNFAITIIDRNKLMETKNVIGKNPFFIELNKIESVDIDDEIDFEFAEFLYKKYGLKWIIDKD